MLPDFLTIGAEKAGTTWLYEVLRQHPQVFMPDSKEIHFFNKYDSNNILRDNFNNIGIDWYKQFFKGAMPDQIKGEVTPMYLCDTEAPNRIFCTLPNIKIIVSLRNPIDRAISHYKMAISKGHINYSFDSVVSMDNNFIIERGMYSRQIKILYDYFEMDQVHIVIFERMMANPLTELSQIAHHIGVNPEPFEKMDLKEKHNSATHYRSKWFYRFSTQQARFLRENKNISWIAPILKSSGIYNSLKNLNKAPPASSKPDVSFRPALEKVYQQDIVALRTLLGNKIPEWSDFL